MIEPDDWTVRNEYGGGTPSEAVVESVAAATDRSVMDLSPLYDVVDSEALDVMFARGADATASFEYEGCEVTVTETHVVVRAVDDAAQPPSQ